ncbi:MAG: anaerobic ribonucleoside-triphosphate reductase [Candidatus Odinarchaeota archaeon]
MGTDKNQSLLEKQLKTLGQKIRIDILKKLKNVQSPLSFSKLQKDVLGHNLSSVNLSFHLNTLKESELIITSDEGYSISPLGEKIIDKILSIEEILNKQNKTIMIRTSKYSKELFDTSKIEEYLVNEGDLERYLAKQISHEVEERLSRTNIEYMTAPLMREFINVVLLENGLEEVRHRLTRLGTPPFEVSQLFNSKEKQFLPEAFIKRLGSDVSEQFLLLNLLPKNLADLYLSGEIALLHLNYWSLRPLSIYLNTKTLIDYLSKKNSIDLQNDVSKSKLNNIISQLIDILYQLKNFYSEDLLLGEFNTYFLSCFSSSKIKLSQFNILASQLLRFNTIFNDGKSHLSLGFNNNGKTSDNLLNLSQVDKEFYHSMIFRSKDRIKPLLLLNISDNYLLDSKNSLLKYYIEETNKGNLFLCNSNINNLLNSSIIQIPDIYNNIIILDKILINLHRISEVAKQNDDKFLEILENKLNSVFEFFKYKEKLVRKKLRSLKQWVIIGSEILNQHNEDLIRNSLKSISFFGLNEAILNHCGIELDRTENSKKFAFNVLSLMRELIEEKNELDGNNFILSQPHYDSYLKDTWYNGSLELNRYKNHYSSKLIRNESKLSLNKKISLFKRFQKIFNGGTLFLEKINTNELSVHELLKNLFKSEIKYISLKDCFFE